MKILVNEYQLQRQIYDGLGGGEWLAQELSGRRKVLIRLMPKQIRNDAASIERIQSQFNKLKPVIDELNIRNLVFPDRFFNNVDSEPFLLSQFVEGEPVGIYAEKWRKAEGRFPLDLIPKIFEPVAEILDALQQKDFIHRFLTPDSIIINRTDGVKLIDFELTGIIREQVIKLDPRSLVGEISKVRYIAPEILRGQPATQLSDQYSLAMIIYEILAGKALFDAEKISVLLKQITDLIPPNISNCPLETSQILKKALSKKTSSRFQTTRQFIDELVQSCYTENNETTNNAAYKLQGNNESDNMTLTNQSEQNNLESTTILLPKILSEFESAATFKEVKEAMNALRKNKIESSVIKRILWERRSQKFFFFCYSVIFVGCIIVTIIFREQLTIMIKDLMNW
ncbi:MAG: protein kinase [Planctomycetaceae bacterium]|jgi:serine/threonine protein kinase|nr:protein kinase [Planctomycetaceae bacterium]